MLEQMGTYALELSRRGYVVMTWDYSGCHNSDIPTGGAETTPGAVSGLPTMGAETVWNTVKSFSFVDFDKIITMGHSMGGQYTMAFALIQHCTDGIVCDQVIGMAGFRHIGGAIIGSAVSSGNSICFDHYHGTLYGRSIYHGICPEPSGRCIPASKLRNE